jgi:hypothetical protein
VTEVIGYEADELIACLRRRARLDSLDGVGEGEALVLE